MNDFSFNITVGRSRKSTAWSLKRTTWQRFAERCADPVRTDETVQAYRRMTKDRQSDIKDVGGFVAASFRGQRRVKRDVQLRSAVTLDLDFCDMPSDELADMVVRNSMGAAVIIYSTHKHTPEEPRLRIVTPFLRDVPADIYEPVARMWAKQLGVIDMCDATTFETSRLFYWPSVSKDGEYFFRQIDGLPLKSTDVLGLYEGDWKDARLWPLTPHEDVVSSPEEHRGGGGSIEDPLEKQGIIGAFCRAHFPISRAITELLGDVYQGDRDHFTYFASTTHGGAIVINDRWLRSYHNTDPACGRMLNIYDLVRVHRFGDLDDGSRVRNEDKLPSAIAMADFAAKDEATRIELHRTRLKAFEDIEISTEATEARQNASHEATEAAETETDTSWVASLDVDKHGDIEATRPNIQAIMENDPALKDRIGYDQLSSDPMKIKPVPWSEAGIWTKTDDAALRIYFERKYSIDAADKIKDATEFILDQNKFHPIRDYLSALPEWDGERRVETLFIDYLGAEDNELNRRMSKLMLTAAVARVMQPGCKFDNCMILAGAEGLGKSTVLAALGGEWFSDSVNNMDGKEGMMTVQGCWIIELGELNAIKRSEATQVKNFISKQHDYFRKPYDTRNNKYMRQCVFFGTTNEDAFLKGLDGNRRFWVVPVGIGVPTKSPWHLKDERDQIWAEALKMYHPGIELYLPGELENEARERTKEFNIDADGEDALKAALIHCLEAELPYDWKNFDLQRRRAWWRNSEAIYACCRRDYFCIPEFLCERMGMELADDNYRYKARRIGKIMRELDGWEPISSSRHAEKVYGIQKAWRRKGVGEYQEEDL